MPLAQPARDAEEFEVTRPVIVGGGKAAKMLCVAAEDAASAAASAHKRGVDAAPDPQPFS
jgi:hypothetical protein